MLLFLKEAGMTCRIGRSASIAFVALIAALLTDGFTGEALAKVHRAHMHVRGAVYQSHAQLVSPEPDHLGPMRYYGGPKSPMWREVR